MSFSSKSSNSSFEYSFWLSQTIATYASAAFSSLAVKKGKTGIAVIYEVTCVEQVKHQAGQEFTYLDWRLTGISVRWYEEVGKDKIIDGEE